MEAGNRAAGDGDEAEGEDFAGEDRTGAIDEAREVGHLQHRPRKENADGEQQDYAQFHESA